MKTTNRAARTITVTAAAALLGASTMIPIPASASTVRADETTIPDATWSALNGAISSSHVFDGQVATSAGVAPELVNDFATGWAAAGGSVSDATLDGRILAAAEAAAPRACTGRNSLDYTGIQLNAYLNSCNSARLLGMVNQGAGVAVIAAAVTGWTGVGGVAAGTIAGVFAISGGLITTCSARGRGMAAHMIPPTAVMWCNNQ